MINTTEVKKKPKIKQRRKVPIHVELSVRLVKHGYKFLGITDLGEVSGNCNECGHSIRYEYRVEDLTDRKKYILGSECIYKVVALQHWEKQISKEDLQKKQLLRAGKWRWIITRDNLIPYIIGKIPEPKNYSKDYVNFANAMRSVVLKARKKLKVEQEKVKAEKQKEYLRKKKIGELKTEKEDFGKFLVKHEIDKDAIELREGEFLVSIWRRTKYTRGQMILTEKQAKWFNDIKKKKNIERPKRPKSTKTIKDRTGFVKMPTKSFDILSDWEKKFVVSVKKRIEDGESLTEKQIEKANVILEKMKKGVPSKPGISVSSTKGYVVKNYVGKRTTPWITEQKTGIRRYGTIVFVHRETEKAILCDFTVAGSSYIKKWIPKSQIKD